MGTNIIDFLHTTAAYQTAVVQLLTFESEKLAEKLTLAESRPLVVISAEIAPPGFGPSGTISTTNFSYYYSFGQLYSVTRNDAFPKDQDSTNLWKLAGEKSLIDTNGAYQLATQILSRLQIDVAAMEQALPPGCIKWWSCGGATKIRRLRQNECRCLYSWSAGVVFSLHTAGSTR